MFAHIRRVNDDEEMITLTAMCIRRSQFGFFWRARGGGRMRGAARGHFCTMCPPTYYTAVAKYFHHITAKYFAMGAPKYA